ncbi:MAG TPA: YifB family Mg chelatase-like AAA ATPase [Acidimicrobiales bacterium]|nr:YifB family Mg chelatase-like AAA ATPase [Acidimicrobiales bacterium]
MLASISSACLLGIDGHAVRVEVHLANGLPGFTIVGLPDAACREARDRVRAAVTNSGYAFPGRKITVNLAPSWLRKAGSGLDLAIAVGVLAASEQVPGDQLDRLAFFGELGLDGSLRPVRGMVSLVDAAPCPTVVVPAASVAEATVYGRHQVRSACRLVEVVEALQGEAPWPEPPDPSAEATAVEAVPDLADVRGQHTARQALEVAAAGGHHLLMVGPPGAGKTMLASRLPGLLPPLGVDEALEVARIRSALGEPLPAGELAWRPPFRAPHHTASPVSLTGGGTGTLRPGEVSRASRGVLFLDELGEFAPSVLDALRQPLEEGVIRITRANATAVFPARFLLVGATNPCPCGEIGPDGCTCSDGERVRYRRRLSGPLLDRFDLRVDVDRPSADELLRGSTGEPTSVVAARVREARARAASRGVVANAHIPRHRLEELCPVTPESEGVLEGALIAGRLSARGLDRIRRVARTLADLAGEDGPASAVHVRMALALRAQPLVAA